MAGALWIDVNTVRGALRVMAKIMQRHRDQLTELDALNGDGDLGVSMDNGFSAVARAADERDLGSLFSQCGRLLNEAAPSTLGTILSFGFAGMAKALHGKERVALVELADAMDSGLALIMDRAGSQPGERTILDSLCPAVSVLRDSARAGRGASAWHDAAAAAAAGAQATVHMRPVHGRAAYYQNFDMRCADGGAVVGELIFQSIARACAP